jgi:hypothetical protein
VGLAAVGVATFWGRHIYGKDLLRNEREQSPALEVAEFLADTVIILKREHRHRSIHRSLEIMKSRDRAGELTIPELPIAQVAADAWDGSAPRSCVPFARWRSWSTSAIPNAENPGSRGPRRHRSGHL